MNHLLVSYRFNLLIQPRPDGAVIARVPRAKWTVERLTTLGWQPRVYDLESDTLILERAA